MSDLSSESRAGTAWRVGAVLAAIVGGAVTAAFTVWWFPHVGGDCGVVRFYEQLFGVVIVGGWLAGTTAGLMAAFTGSRRSAKAVVIGSIIVIVTNVAAVAVCARVVHGVREADYTRKSTEQLLDFLAGNNLDARIFSAHALGERRAVEALVPLCEILDNAGEDINLRHNAATALGNICAPPRPPGVDVDRALASLTGALKDRDEYLPYSIAQALGQIGDDRAVGPLAEFLADKSRPINAREEVVRALGKIGGEKARAALENALSVTEDETLKEMIRSAIKMAENP